MSRSIEDVTIKEGEKFVWDILQKFDLCKFGVGYAGNQYDGDFYNIHGSINVNGKFRLFRFSLSAQYVVDTIINNKPDDLQKTIRYGLHECVCKMVMKIICDCESKQDNTNENN
jgi:hypothetical protein